MELLLRIACRVIPTPSASYPQLLVFAKLDITRLLRLHNFAQRVTTLAEHALRVRLLVDRVKAASIEYFLGVLVLVKLASFRIV